MAVSARGQLSHDTVVRKSPATDTMYTASSNGMSVERGPPVKRGWQNKPEAIKVLHTEAHSQKQTFWGRQALVCEQIRT